MNNREVTVFIENVFQIVLHDNADSVSIPDIVFTEQVLTEEESYRRIDPKTLIELSVFSIIDSMNSTRLERREPAEFGKSHYTISYSLVSGGERKAINKILTSIVMESGFFININISDNDSLLIVLQ